MPPSTLLLGTRKGLLHFQRRHGNWELERESFLGAPVPYVIRDPRNGTLWASIDHGHWGSKLHRSRDEGMTWEEVEAPKYPDGALVREGVPAATRYIWTIAPGGADYPDRLFLGTEPGGLFRSDDGGDSFALVESLWNHPSRLSQWFGGGRDEAGIHSVIVDPRDNRRVLVGISCAGVFETTDDGVNWEPRNVGVRADYLADPDVAVGQDPHLVTMAPSNPDIVWQQNHVGIFRSVDGASNWVDITEKGGPASFGFAVAVAEDNPDRAWVVPARSDEQRTAIDHGLFVCRTDDGGVSWQQYRNGLPQKNVYDLTFRHALDICGSTLAFGTTNGNIYVSDDDGESWETVANHLPPVYSVRFA